LFTLSYEEETGWGGEHEYLRGEQLEGSEYNWKCRECDYEETDEPPYCEDCEHDMCPSCGYGEPDEKCQTHMLQSESTEKAETNV
jgi:peptide subunit release factor 1 (eRF1)